MTRRPNSTVSPPPLPEAYLTRQRALLGDEGEAFIAALDQPPTRALRINGHKTTLPEISARLGFTVDPVPWCPTASYLPSQLRPGDSVEHRAGLFYLQEPSSMAVVQALRIEPHHHVLDLAAAPGGKSTHAASGLGPDGFLLANDVVPARMGPLLANLDAWGYRNTAGASTRVAHLVEVFPGAFDRVIVDAPCSGEALFRRDPASRSQWSEAAVRGAARRQGKLLALASGTVRPGGLLAYSTCTFNAEENEERVASFMAGHAGWALVDPPTWPDAVPGAAGLGARFYPHRCRCEGQFVAVLRRPDDEAPLYGRGGAGSRAIASRERGSARGGPGRRPGADGRRSGGSGGSGGSVSWEPAGLHPAWAAFADRILSTPFDPDRILLRGEQFYLVPPVAGLPVESLLRPGVALGRLVGSTFRPAHALALTLRPDEVTGYEALDDGELAAFRAGTPVHRPGPRGWVLVTAGRWPVGWAQRKDDELTARLPGHARDRHARG